MAKKTLKYLLAGWLVITLVLSALHLGWVSVGLLVIAMVYLLFRFLSTTKKSRIPARLGGIALLIVAVPLITVGLRLFVFEVATVPSPSMERTIALGDRIFVDQLAYGPRVPRTLADVPWLHVLNLYSAGPEAYRANRNSRRPFTRLSGYSSVQRNDVLVFNNPLKPTLVLTKRCIGMPGDTLQIVNGEVYVNGTKRPRPPTAPLRDVKSPEWKPYKAWRSNEILGWDFDNLGLLVVPKRGMKIELTLRNRAIYQDLIDSTANARFHTVELDHYFVLGDNWDNSQDSRYFGFVPEHQIKGRVAFIF